MTHIVALSAFGKRLICAFARRKGTDLKPETLYEICRRRLKGTFDLTCDKGLMTHIVALSAFGKRLICASVRHKGTDPKPKTLYKICRRLPKSSFNLP
jgi:hypothetical protein